MVKIAISILHVLLLVQAISANSQGIKITGRVSDYSNGEPIPFANVFFNNTTIGAVTDFEGYYTIEVNAYYDSISASYIGFKTVSKSVSQEAIQTINFLLDPSVVNLKEIVFRAGENPAHLILRNIIKNKKKNDKRALQYYEYDSYNRVEIAIDNISEKLSENKIMRDVMEKLDSIEILNDEHGKRIIPVFLSKVYQSIMSRTIQRLKRKIF